METATETIVTFWICGTCRTFHSDEPIPSDPKLRSNGGQRQCRDCRRSQHKYDEDRAAARDDAYYG